MANFWDTLRTAISTAYESFRGGLRDSPEPSPVIESVEKDPFDDYYEEDEDERHERLDQFNDMVDWLDDAPESLREADYGAVSPDEVPDPSGLRLVRYATAEDAQNFLEEAGLSGFGYVVFYEDDYGDIESYGIYIDPDGSDPYDGR